MTNESPSFSNTTNQSIPNNKVTVFDFPTRLFHWIFAFSILGAFSIGKFTSDEGALFPLHMLFGAMAFISVLFRIIWGIIGTRYARFSSFNLSPTALVAYIKNAFVKGKDTNINRNPASSFAALGMMALALIIPFTGYLMITAANEGTMHDIKEVHETLATIMMLIVGTHLMGIFVHKIMKGDNIGTAMISGKKTAYNNEKGIRNKAPIAAAILLSLIGGSAFALTNNYNPKTKALKIGQNTYQLGENEGNEHGEMGENEEAGEKGEASEAMEHKSGEVSENEAKEELRGVNAVSASSENGEINENKEEKSERMNYKEREEKEEYESGERNEHEGRERDKD